MTIARRTPEDIKQRIELVAYEDPFGFHREVLISALTFEVARDAGYLREDATGEGWVTLAGDDLVEAARSYLTFAVGKILDHRGISASRSVDKLTEFAWLMGRDDVVVAMEAAGYQNYGAPKVKTFAAHMEWLAVWTEAAETSLEDLERMASGLSCFPGCEDGCDR